MNRLKSKLKQKLQNLIKNKNTLLILGSASCLVIQYR